MDVCDVNVVERYSCKQRDERDESDYMYMQRTTAKQVVMVQELDICCTKTTVIG